MSRVAMEEAFDPFGLQAEQVQSRSSVRGQPIGTRKESYKTTHTSRDGEIAAPGAVDTSVAGSEASTASAFDPFGIGAIMPSGQQTVTNAQPRSRQRLDKPQHDNAPVFPRPPTPPSPPVVARISRQSNNESGASDDSHSPAHATTIPSPVTPYSPSTASAIALPPKINVKLTVREQVSSKAIVLNSTTEGASEVTIEGSVYAQIQCSDATKNAPFGLIAHVVEDDEDDNTRDTDASYSSTSLTLRPNADFCNSEQIVKIPKQEIGFVPVAHYSFANKVQHMPLLLERKVTVSGSSCRIAVQVRSKLSNRGHMHDFVLCVAIPECVDGDSIEMLRGDDGVYDELQRTLQWRLPTLHKGESYMVSAACLLWESQKISSPIRPELQFPVILRCKADADQISRVAFRAVPADGFPASVTYGTTHSFRLLHRLP